MAGAIVLAVAVGWVVAGWVAAVAVVLAVAQVATVVALAVDHLVVAEPEGTGDIANC
jgi:hypothetical protein